MTATTVIALCIFIPAKSKVIAAEPVNQYLQLDNNGWWYVENGAINFNYNGLADNEYGNWKITNGLVDFGYNGTYDGKEIVNGCIVSEEFDGYDRFGNKFVEEFDGEGYYKYFDADNPYILDTYEWTDDGRCISVIKDLGVCSYSEADDRFVDMWDGIENQLMDECYKKNPKKQCVSDVTSLGCYNGHWLIEFRCVSVDTMYISVELNRKYNHLYPLYFYDKEGNLRI